MSQADTMNMLEHTGITAATTVAVKTALAGLSKCITVAKDMYNAPSELDALEEEIGLVRMLVKDMDDVRDDNLSSSAIRALWWRLDSKVREVEQFINDQLRKNNSEPCEGGDAVQDIERQGIDRSSTSGPSANRFGWSRHAQKILVFKTEIKDLREMLRDALLSVNTYVLASLVTKLSMSTDIDSSLADPLL
jgi:hypothetical protein